jgi:hypothetical protein
MEPFCVRRQTRPARLADPEISPIEASLANEFATRSELIGIRAEAALNAPESIAVDEACAIAHELFEVSRGWMELCETVHPPTLRTVAYGRYARAYRALGVAFMAVGGWNSRPEADTRPSTPPHVADLVASANRDILLGIRHTAEWDEDHA